MAVKKGEVNLDRILIKVIHVDLRNVRNDQQSFYWHHFHIIILPILSCSIIMYYDINYTLELLHIKSSHPNFEVIVNVNRL